MARVCDEHDCVEENNGQSGLEGLQQNSVNEWGAMWADNIIKWHTTEAVGEFGTESHKRECEVER